jgi:hypothetical protein
MSPAAATFWRWHPFTPAGVAAAAGAPRWQLWIGLGTTALLSVAVVLWFLGNCWSPVVTEAIDQLEDGGFVRDGVFHPGGAKTDLLLAGNRHLAIALDWTASGARDEASDVRLILQIDRALGCSLFGCVTIGYAELGDFPVGRTETGAWWDAWQPIIYTTVGFGQVVFLILSWWLLGIAYAWAIRFFAFYLDRDVDFAGATRVAQAALIPGALWLTGALLFYGRGWLSLFGLLVVFVMHLPVGWLFAGFACHKLPPRPDVLPPNPFHVESQEPGEEPANPFRGAGRKDD